MTTGTACTLRLLCSIVVFALSVSGLADAAEGLPEGSSLNGERSLAMKRAPTSLKAKVGPWKRSRT